MLVAKVGRISQEMDAAALALEAARAASGSGSVRPQVESPEVPLSIPNSLFQPLDVKLSVAGVEVGGVLAWVQRAMVEDRVLSFSVQYADDKAIVMGQVPGGSPFYLEGVTPKPPDIVDAVAYSLVRDHLARRIPEVVAMDVADVKTLLTTLQAAADLDKQTKLGRPGGEGFAPLLGRLDGLIAKMPRWTALIQVAAEMAENARDDAKALGLYAQLQEQTDDSSPFEERLTQKVRLLEARARQSRLTAAAAPAPAAPVLATETVREDPALASLLRDPNRAAIFELCGIRSLDMKAEVSVAVLGGVPSRLAVPEERVTIIQGAVRPRTDPMMQEYLDTVVQWVRLVAPNARFVFRPVKGSGGGSFTDKELVEAVNDLVAQQPQVLLVTLGPLESDQYAKLFEAAAAAGTVVVIAAGNDGNKRPVPFAGTALLDRLMVVSAVALDGRPAEFTQRDPKSFWAPGVDFPVVLGDGKTEKRAGTTCAAALAAGIAARIVADGRATRPEDVIRVLRDTARPAAKRAEPPILRLDAALRA